MNDPELLQSESLNEADTCRKYVTPGLQAAGWEAVPHSLVEQYTFTAGRIVVRGNRAKRKPGRRADYLLRYTRDFPIAVVEAKAEDLPAAQGRTVEERQVLQTRGIVGGEAKPLPYLLCQMNLLLHRVESPAVSLDNSLKVRLGEIGEKDRVEVILTNPPFGGEEPSVQHGFPHDKRTSETALLFLQLIMRKLHRSPKPGRAGMVVPNGTLFADGVAARIKEELLQEFNLHTIVRLPVGVFAPYTSIPTNLLFFDASGPMREIWYYEQPLPEGRKGYTKTQPIAYEEMAPLRAWWSAQEENERAWRVEVGGVLRYDGNGALVSANLDVKNPNRRDDFAHLPPEQLVRDILELVQNSTPCCHPSSTGRFGGSCSSLRGHVTVEEFARWIRRSCVAGG